jgi:hypothetical protein
VPLPVALPVPPPVVVPPELEPLVDPVVEPVDPVVVVPVVEPVVDPVVLPPVLDWLAHSLEWFCHDFPVQSMLEFVALPKDATAITMTAAMRTTMTEYSTAVAPRSLRKTLVIRCMAGLSAACRSGA